MIYQEIYADLFSLADTHALAHCISVDCAMGAGIAKEFRRRYPSMPGEIGKNFPVIGDAILCSYKNHYIYNLITKQKYWHKPTYESFTETIKSLKRNMIISGHHKLAIPLLGAGLDRLSWAKNREIIKDIFKDTDIEIIVCKLK